MLGRGGGGGHHRGGGHHHGGGGGFRRGGGGGWGWGYPYPYPYSYYEPALAIDPSGPPYPDLEPRYRAVAPLMTPTYRWSDGYLEMVGMMGTWVRLDRSMATYVIAGAESRAMAAGGIARIRQVTAG